MRNVSQPSPTSPAEDPQRAMASTRRFEDIVEAISAYHPVLISRFIQRAYIYSAKVHAGQVRKSGEPYLIHPLEVAFLLTQLRLDEASIVTGCCMTPWKTPWCPCPTLKKHSAPKWGFWWTASPNLSQIHFDTDEHKQAENFRKMLVAMAKDIRVILVKLADRLHNMRTCSFCRPASSGA